MVKVGQIWKIKDDVEIKTKDLSRHIFITRYCVDRNRGDVVYFRRLGSDSQTELKAFATEVSVKCELVRG